MQIAREHGRDVRINSHIKLNHSILSVILYKITDAIQTIIVVTNQIAGKYFIIL